MEVTLDLLRALPPWMLLFSSLGLISLLRAASSFLHWLYATFLRPCNDLRRRYGSWAVVTGATDGIGKALAFQLARKGLHLVLVGRNPAKLKQVAHEISSRCSGGATEIKLVQVDFNGEDLAGGIRRLEEEIEGLDVGILVNNAGTAHRRARHFHELEEELWTEIVKVNLEATTRVTMAVLPGMVERRRGAVVNIGSGTAVMIPSFPFFSMYASTKSYVDQLSRSLYVEYKSMGIDVQCQVPLYVATKMVSIKRASTLVPSPDDYARAAVRRIGYEPRCSPYWVHSIQWFFLASLIPDFILNSYLLEFARKTSIRKRAPAKDV